MLLLVSSSSQCCSGLVSCIYLKVEQRGVQELRSVCKCQCIFKMQRIYMHSNEHFEVFTTVLAPQGEWNHVCSEVWHHFVIVRDVRATWDISARLLINNGGSLFVYSFTEGHGYRDTYVGAFMWRNAYVHLHITFLLIHFPSHREVSIQSRSWKGKLNHSIMHLICTDDNVALAVGC